jgi:hypothetical protein
MPLIIFRINTLEKYIFKISIKKIYKTQFINEAGDCKNLYIYMYE